MCTGCGKEPHPHKRCPAKDATCNRCNRKGHYAAHCLTKWTQAAAIESETDTVFLGELGSQRNTSWLTTLEPNGHSLQFKLDTGAEVTAISEDAYRTKLQSSQTSPSTKVLYGPSREPLHCIGQFPGKFSHKGKAATQPVFVVRGLKSNLLGLPPITALRLAIRLDNTETTEVPGKLMYTADTLSRTPLADKANNHELEQDMEKFIKVGVVTLPVSEGRLDQYCMAQDKDGLCSKVKTHCKEG